MDNNIGPKPKTGKCLKNQRFGAILRNQPVKAGKPPGYAKPIRSFAQGGYVDKTYVQIVNENCIKIGCEVHIRG